MAINALLRPFNQNQDPAALMSDQSAMVFVGGCLRNLLCSRWLEYASPFT